MSKKKTTPEAAIADTMLAKPFEVTLGGNTYKIAPPTPATLLLVSKLVSQLDLSTDVGELSTTSEQLAFAMAVADGKEMYKVCEIIATIILGAKEIEAMDKKENAGWIEKLFTKKSRSLKELTDSIFYNANAQELAEAVSQVFNSLDIGFFLNTTIFLANLNLTKRTKKTTASTP